MEIVPKHRHHCNTRLLAAQDTHTAALKAYKFHYEQTWYLIVRTMLKSPLPSTFIEFDKSQSCSICAELPAVVGVAGIPVAGVKTDHVLQLNRDNKKVAKVPNPLFGRELWLNLSSFNDLVVVKTFTLAVVEANSPRGVL
jgi:hypothetical protein